MEVVGCPYEVSLDGELLPIEQAGVYSGAFYARFHYARPARLEVRVKATAATSITLKPERFCTNLQSKDQRLAVDIESPGPRVITTVCGSRGIWPLIIFAEASPAPQPKEPRVTFEPTGSNLVRTAELQRVLDGGGVIEFSPGVYRTGPLYVRDNTTARLTAGSVIVSSADPDDFAASDAINRHDSTCPTADRPALINFDGCANAALIGEGVVEGMGHILRNELGVNASLIRLIDAEHIRIEGILLLNSPSWTVHCVASHDVTFDNAKIIDDWSVGNTDGINPDCSQDVTISNYFGYCGDDAVAVKTTSPSDRLLGCSGITVRDSVVMTRKTAFKIGTETHKDVSGVRFENCDAVSTSRGIGIYARDGGAVSDVAYTDVRLDLMEYPGEKTSGAAFTIDCHKRHGTSSVDGVAFERVTALTPYASTVRGLPESPIRNVDFSGCTFEIVDRSIKFRKAPVFDIRHCAGLRTNGCKIRWKARVREAWDGLACQQDAADVDLSGIVEADSPE